MGMLHGALLNQIDGFKVTAIAETSPLILRALRALLPQVKCFRSYQNMISEVPLDAVVIATPSFDHVPAALCAAEKNLGVFIEKPLSNSLASAEALAKVFAEKKVSAQVGFHMRYTPTLVKGRELLAEGVIGRVGRVKSEIYVSDIFSPQNGWRYDPAISGGGVVIDFTVHLLDLLHWYFGEVISLKGEVNKIHSRLVEDEARADLIFQSGVRASLVSSWSVPGYRLPYLALHIEGENGTMLVSDHSIIVFGLNGEPVSKFCTPDLYQGYFFDLAGPSYSLQMQAFTRAVESANGTGNLKEALYAQRLVEAFYRSNQQQQTVQLSEDQVQNG